MAGRRRRSEGRKDLQSHGTAGDAAGKRRIVLREPGRSRERVRVRDRCSSTPQPTPGLRACRLSQLSSLRVQGGGCAEGEAGEKKRKAEGGGGVSPGMPGVREIPLLLRRGGRETAGHLWKETGPFPDSLVTLLLAFLLVFCLSLRVGRRERKQSNCA